MYNDFEKVDCSCMEFVAVDDTCATSFNNTVTFCCSANLPTNFHLNTLATPTILYDLSALFCKIEPCCNASCCNRYNIRVVGSIPFIINAPIPVATAASQCTTPTGSSIYLSAICNAPVNNVVDNVCTYEAAIEACAILRLKLRSCSCVRATVNTPTRDQCSVKFTGTFTFPNTSDPASVTCSAAGVVASDSSL
ncbi:hypothetical protein [Clostridium celatum]|uniref:Uncharacterized protein n=1 Tax=Clostridium celatum DSM 1785 TaxID=545697 RepID=L1Q5D4_9CLOT|nr:hypothetical protein [Clostridium celatum]EKY23214.1 hypothetical protein HMPREF0216_02999 [Clostridium celatum DSM 1785]MCE9655533.1 hypothetical protein [Clostridium celatum]